MSLCLSQSQPQRKRWIKTDCHSITLQGPTVTTESWTNNTMRWLEASNCGHLTSQQEISITEWQLGQSEHSGFLVMMEPRAKSRSKTSELRQQGGSDLFLPVFHCFTTLTCVTSQQKQSVPFWMRHYPGISSRPHQPSNHGLWAAEGDPIHSESCLSLECWTPCVDLRSPLTRSLQLVSSPGAKTQCITSSPATFSTGPECLCTGAKCAYSESRNVRIAHSQSGRFSGQYCWGT